MAKPTQDVVIWAAQDVNLPSLNGPNKTLPITDLLNKGWDKNQKPAADEFNYVLNNLGLYVNWLATEIADPIIDATSLNTPNTVVLRDGSGNFSAGSITAALNGNADTSTKWQTARTLTLAGSVSGSVSMDGSGNVTLNTSIQSSGVSILTGTVAHGGTIPLPSGYTQAQCKWMVSIADDNPINDTWDIDENNAYLHYKFTCSADSNRLVTAQTTHGSGGTLTLVSANANYIIIGVK
ncbi:structural protein [Pseudaeromonas phage vB_PpeM_ KLEP7]|nr:structural protein [Pseudaeromonas phage vB_PpeM_ KLEP7]